MGKETEGQISLCDYEVFSMDRSMYVVQANDLVTGKQNLKTNSAKLIRAAIMQIKPDDSVMKPYIISIKELSQLFGVSTSNLYRDIEDITDDIIQNPVYIKERKNNRTSWVKIPWVSMCMYTEGKGVMLQMNELLRPYLLGLKEQYTQYELGGVLSMKSAYSIRLFELLQKHSMNRDIRRQEQLTISLDEIREACSLEDRYQLFSHLKARVIDTALREICEKTQYRVSIIDYVKKGKACTGVRFSFESSYRKFFA